MDHYRAYEMNPGDAVQTDEQWLDFARHNGQTTYHVGRHLQDGPAIRWRWWTTSCGCTASSGLRVADASVMPTMVSGNTNAPTIMIAEKGADMIRAAARAGMAQAA